MTCRNYNIIILQIHSVPICHFIFTICHNIILLCVSQYNFYLHLWKTTGSVWILCISGWYLRTIIESCRRGCKINENPLNLWHSFYSVRSLKSWKCQWLLLIYVIFKSIWNSSDYPLLLHVDITMMFNDVRWY